MKLDIASSFICFHNLSVYDVYIPYINQFLICLIVYFQFKKPLGLPSNRQWTVQNIIGKVCQQADFNIIMGCDRDHR